MRIGNVNDDPGVVEAVFTSEAAACEYAVRRTGERYRDSGSVTRWELDNPDARTWLSIYQDGRCTHHNERRHDG